MRLIYTQFNSSAPKTKENDDSYDPKEVIKKELINSIEEFVDASTGTPLIVYTDSTDDDGNPIIKAEIKFYRIIENVVVENPTPVG